MESPHATVSHAVHSEIERWRTNGKADLPGVLDRFPSVIDHKSLLLDLIYEEYCLADTKGRKLRLNERLRQFPQYQESIYNLVHIHSILLGDHTPPSVADWPAPGDEVAEVRILMQIGQGAFSRVYLATEPEVGNRTIIVKIAAFTGGEASTLGRLAHPYITPILWTRYDDSTHLQVIAMPFCGLKTGLDLLEIRRCHPQVTAATVVQLIRETPDCIANHWLPVERERPIDSSIKSLTYIDYVLTIGLQLADALATAHTKGIIHRDIKPTNILLSWDGRALLLDFNLAADRDDERLFDGGTLAYMAPERLRKCLQRGGAGTAEWDPAEDVFSLGIVLYEMLAGRVPTPMDSHDDAEAYVRFLLASRRIGLWPLEVDKTLRALIERCLSFDAAHRPTARELATKLERCLTWRFRAIRYGRRHPRRVFMAGGAAATAALVWARQPTRRERLETSGAADYSAGRFESALKNFNEALELDPTSKPLRFARGQSYLQLKKFSLAEDDFNALNSNSDTTKPSLLLRECTAYAYLRNHHHDVAAYHYQKILSNEAENTRVLNNLAFSHLQRGRRKEAVEILDTALAISPDNPHLRHHRAYAQLVLAVQSGTELPGSAWEDIRFAVDQGRHTPLTFLDAATIALGVKSTESDIAPLALSFLEAAVKLGFDFKRIETDVRFAPLRSSPAFQRLAEISNSRLTVDRDAEMTIPPPSELRFP